MLSGPGAWTRTQNSNRLLLSAAALVEAHCPAIDRTGGAAASVDRAFLRIEALNPAIEQMWEDGSANDEIAKTLRWAADELNKNR